MKRVALVAVVGACAGAPRSRDAQIAQAIASHDPAAIRATMWAHLLVDEVRFEDPACRERFGRVNHEVLTHDFDALAACLAALPVTAHDAEIVYPSGVTAHVRAEHGKLDRLSMSTPPMFDSTRVHRLVGDPETVEPSRRDADDIRLHFGNAVTAIARLCVDTTGVVTRAEMARPSGVPGYDALVLAAARKWRYPAIVDRGVAIEACTHETFTYSQPL